MLLLLITNDQWTQILEIHDVVKTVFAVDIWTLVSINVGYLDSRYSVSIDVCVMKVSVHTGRRTTTHDVIECRRTEHHLGRRLRRQPEYDQREERQQNAGQNQDVVVERGDAAQWYGKRQVRVGRVTARVVFDVLLSRMTQDLPLVACRVVAHVNLQPRIIHV